nr:sulfotransferase [Saprospiraceae bacterium]
MCVLIGGSGSTGSSLLKNLLNNHSKIFAGVETSLFCKKKLYQDWESHKGRIFKKGVQALPNHSFLYLRGMDLLHSGFGWTESELRSEVKDSKSFPEFCNRFFKRPLLTNNAQIWVEKTPSNAACFRYFLQTFPVGKVIHITRDPFDTLSSLLRRGIPEYNALCIYLLNTAAAMSCEKDSRYHLVKYEDLVMKPESTLEKICGFLEVDFQPDMTNMGGIEADFTTRLKGWNYDETEPVKKGSLGAFTKLPPELQAFIREAAQAVKISTYGRQKYQTHLSTIQEVCESLNYEYPEVSIPVRREVLGKLRKQKLKDQWFRLRKACPNAFLSPVKIGY